VVSYGRALTTVETARSPYSTVEVPLLGTHRGCVRVAQFGLPDQTKLSLISAYGLIDYGYAVTTMQRILSDLTPLFDNARYNAQIVLAGDLNLSTQLAPPHRARHQNAFDRIKAFGLVDCLDRMLGKDRPLPGCPCGAAKCRHVQTFRFAGRPHAPWQDDYLFASPRLANKLTACYADSAGAAWDYSDHCPVVAEFEL
jgi:hypothetical protein